MEFFFFLKNRVGCCNWFQWCPGEEGCGVQGGGVWCAGKFCMVGEKSRGFISNRSNAALLRLLHCFIEWVFGHRC